MTSLNTTEPADTTDAELRERLSHLVGMYANARDKEDVRDMRYCLDEVLALIHAHTDTLLERVEKEVIGEDEPYQKPVSKRRTYSEIAQYSRWALRAEQRTALATIKGEEK